jgi:predicted DCC family thiol-disulfide oxidoreductase YuxK
MTNTIIYDGNCKFCKRFADWCIKSNKGFNAISVRES